MGQRRLLSWDKMLNKVLKVVLVSGIISFVGCVNSPGVLLNAILRKFTSAVEQGSPLKFIMYSAVSPSLGHIGASVIHCANLCLSPRCWFSNFSMTRHSSPCRRLWTCTTAFSLRTLPVSSLSSTRSMMGNDVLSALLHELSSLYIWLHYLGQMAKCLRNTPTRFEKLHWTTELFSCFLSIQWECGSHSGLQ